MGERGLGAEGLFVPQAVAVASDKLSLPGISPDPNA